MTPCLKDLDYPVLLLVILICLFSCRSASSGRTAPEYDCRKYIDSLPDSVYCEFNQDTSCYLCQDKKIHNSNASIPGRANSIFIIRCSDGMLLFHENITGGMAHWRDRENLELFYPSGFPKDPSELTYIFNIASGKKYKSSLKSR
jgi:hypothetical protein